MQLYLEGTNPLYWHQISELPDGVYNKDTNQTSSATINQLFTAFIDRAVGTAVDIYMSVDGGNLVKITTAKVVDNTGFLYARFPIPYSRSIDRIEITIKESGPNFSPADKTIASEVFSSGHIAYMFEIQAKAAHQALVDAVQLEQDLTISGVEDPLLGPKFGVFTGLTRRADQPVSQYRAQTACLWNAFQYAATDKGVADAIKCVIGDFDGDQTVVIFSSMKTTLPNQVFTLPQFGATGSVPGFFVDDPATSGMRWDEDTPHYYVPDLGVTGRGFYVDEDDLPTFSVMGSYPDEGTGQQWDTDTVRVFTVPGTNAIGNESLVEITSTVSLGVPEEAALATVTAEEVLRRNPPLTTPPTPEWGEDDPDYVVNPYVASPVNITSCVINGLLKTELADLPKETVDYTVTPLEGKIVWNDPASGFKVPDTGTVYTANYKFRLDNQLRAVISKIKPVHKSVVVLFSRISSGLPRALEI